MSRWWGIAAERESRWKITVINKVYDITTTTLLTFVRRNFLYSSSHSAKTGHRIDVSMRLLGINYKYMRRINHSHDGSTMASQCDIRIESVNCERHRRQRRISKHSLVKRNECPGETQQVHAAFCTTETISKPYRGYAACMCGRSNMSAAPRQLAGFSHAWIRKAGETRLEIRPYDGTPW